MAAKSKKRLYKIDNKLLKLEKLELKDVVCSICQSILVEPVTLPCYHDFCLVCFNGSIENNALCCPLCRLRIGSWLRTASKQKNLVNLKLWKFIQVKFSHEIECKTKGEDIDLPEEKPQIRLSTPGEIRSEYEAELRRLRKERLQLEQKHLQETELLIKKLQEEEEEAQRKYIECVKRDELLALHMHAKECVSPHNTCKKQVVKTPGVKPRLKATKIDRYLARKEAPISKESVTSDNTSIDGVTAKATTVRPVNGTSPEMVPSYGKLIKNFIESKKIKVGPGLWNKENGDTKEKRDDEKEGDDNKKDKSKVKSSVPSLLVSLPYTGILQHKINATDNRSKETGSVDSMRQELCYFKPIEGTTPTSFSSHKGLPVRVPGLRMNVDSTMAICETTPSRDQYLDGLCQLRNLSLAKNLPSAFVIAINILKANKKETNTKWNMSKSKSKKPASSNSCAGSALPIKRNPNRNKHLIPIAANPKSNKKPCLRRTRSMGSITKNENETTPKKNKIKQRKVYSDRKPCLRSDSKKKLSLVKMETCTTPPVSETRNNNKVNLAVKNLSSPLKNCDVKMILQEQLRIEKIIEQEKIDLELARKMDAEWNGRRQYPRRTAVKRQITLNYALRPAKKLKV